MKSRIACKSRRFRLAGTYRRLSESIAKVGLISLAALTGNQLRACELPAEINTLNGLRGVSLNGEWGIRELVEMRDVGSPFGGTNAIAVNGAKVAFIVKQSCISSGLTSYALYAANLGQADHAKRLVESSFLADVTTHPRTNFWTIRGDFGTGVQLYDIDEQGEKHPLVHTNDLVNWGGEYTFFGPPHKEGVISYGWAPDGSGLWYARATMRPEADRHGGYVFDGTSMQSRDLLNDSGEVGGIELRYFSPTLSVDRQVAAVRGGGLSSWSHVFSSDLDLVRWGKDSASILYKKADFDIKPDGSWDREGWWSVNVPMGNARRLNKSENPKDTSTGRGTYLTVDTSTGKQRHLLEMDVQGHVVRDGGAVGFSRILRVLRTAADRSAPGADLVLAVRYDTYDSIAVVQKHGKTRELASNDNLRECAFSVTGTLGACVRETLTRPPAIAVVSTKDFTIKSLVPLNPQLSGIPSLVFESAQWTNKYGHITNGYITFPRHYVPGTRYPAVLISHDQDATNRFPPGLLWDFPVEVLAERGYVVILAQESPVPLDTYGAVFDKHVGVSVDEAQQAYALEAVSSMEAAVADVERRGIVNQEMVGIAGWSRGGEVVEYAMSQSKVFRAGIIADGYVGPDIYWMGGINMWPRVARAVYGGSPYDQTTEILDNYRRLSPTFRAKSFAGPLLLLAPSAGAVLDNMEPLRFISEATIPVESVYFPHEGHIFWDPRDRAAVMQRSLQWFDYWLQGRKDPGQGAEEIYTRWDKLADGWRKSSSAHDLSSLR